MRKHQPLSYTDVRCYSDNVKTFSKATGCCDPEDLKIHINDNRKFMFFVIFRGG